MDDRVRVWQARDEDLDVAGRLLHDFNVEFDEPTPSPAALAERLRTLTSGVDTVVLLADSPRRGQSAAPASPPAGVPGSAPPSPPTGAPLGIAASGPLADVLGIAVLRLREAIWSESRECYLAELYVVPPHRRRGVGRALMLAATELARDRGATSMEIGVDEPDLGARALYESLGFSNRTGAGGHVMYVYEREL